MTDLQKELFKLRDEKYREFHKNLIPTVDADTVMNVILHDTQIPGFFVRLFGLGDRIAGAVRFLAGLKR